MKVKELELHVSNHFQKDAGERIARINHEVKKELNLSIGDIIEIEGKKKTSAIARDCHPSDSNKLIIRIDKLTRSNAEIDLGDRVIIRKANTEFADEIKIAPIIAKGQKIQFGTGIESLLKKGLNEIPLSKEDLFIVKGIELFGSTLPFKVLETDPEGIVIISEKTRIKVLEEGIELPEMKPEKYFSQLINLSDDEIDKLFNEYKKLEEKIIKKNKQYSDIILELFPNMDKTDLYKIYLYGFACCNQGAGYGMPNGWVEGITLCQIIQDKQGSLRYGYDFSPIVKKDNLNGVISRLEKLLLIAKSNR